MHKAEKRCRHLHFGAISFSPATEDPKRKLAFWELAIRRRKGLRVSQRLWRRRKKKANITDSTCLMSLDDMIDQVKLQHKAYRTARKLHQEECKTFLDTLRPQDRKRLKLNEAARDRGLIPKLITGKLESKSVTKVEVNGVECTKKCDIEAALKRINYAKIRACDPTPFLNRPLSSKFGHLTETNADQQVLQGTFHPPTNTNFYAQALLEYLK